MEIKMNMNRPTAASLNKENIQKTIDEIIDKIYLGIIDNNKNNKNELIINVYFRDVSSIVKEKVISYFVNETDYKYTTRRDLDPKDSFTYQVLAW